MPNLQLPQTYPSSVSSGTSPSRVGSLDSSSNYGGTRYSTSLTSASSFSGANPVTGLKTPSPSPALQNATTQAHEESVQQHQFPSASLNSQPFGQDTDSYGGTMIPNQPYLDSQHPHMTSGPPYASQPQTTSGMPHYTQYQQQAPGLQPTHGSYAQSPSYQQYGYATGVTSPQSIGQVSAPQMNSQLLPLPSKTLAFQRRRASTKTRQLCLRLATHNIHMVVRVARPRAMPRQPLTQVVRLLLLE